MEVLRSNYNIQNTIIAELKKLAELIKTLFNHIQISPRPDLQDVELISILKSQFPGSCNIFDTAIYEITPQIYSLYRKVLKVHNDGPVDPDQEF